MALQRVGGEVVGAPRRAPMEDTHIGDATLFGLPVELQKTILEHVRPTRHYYPSGTDKEAAFDQL